jgi:hypothetical protein
MMRRQKNRTALTLALGLAALGLAGCDDAHWLIGQATKGGSKGGSSDTSGGPAGGATCVTPGTGGASGQPACKSEVLGGETVCLDVAALKQNAYLACEKSGLLLNDYVPYESCGTQSYRFVKYVCCPKAEPPPPPPGQCTYESQGGETSCKDVATWKQYASDACVAAGKTLTDYSPGVDCGNGNYRYVKYTCCGKPVPPPPPPEECTTESQGSETSCKDVATWTKHASDSCAAAGKKLTSYSPGVDCGNGGYRYVKYTCCGAPVPPPPPPPDQCTTESQGSDISCKDVATWKQHASDSCAAAGKTLTGYSPGVDCGNGGYRYVKYTCCAATASPAVPTVVKD